MAKAILNEDRIITLTTDPAGTEIGSLPANTGLDELRFDGTSLITISDTTAVTSFYVEETAEEGFILHIISGSGWQLVSMTWDDRNILINSNGTIRVKTPAELLYETNALSFDSGIVQSENIVERQVDYTRKVSTDIVITDKSRRSPNDLDILFNGLADDYITIDTTSDLHIDSTSEIDYWIQYRFPVERAIKNAFNFGIYNTTGSNIVAAYFSYSLNGQDWTYLALPDSTATLLIEYDTFELARPHYVTFTDAMMTENGVVYRFLRGISAKYFRIHFLSPSGVINQNNFKLSELRFNEITKPQEIEVERLSAFTANVGLLEAGVVQSKNFSDGGVKFDLDNDVLEVYDAFGTLRVKLGKLS